MISFSKVRSIHLAAVAVLISGCMGGLGIPPPPPGAVGRVTGIEGPNAFVESGGNVMPAVQGQWLINGDRFFTGDGSRLTVAFLRGGYVELDANTDPAIFQEAGCLAIRLFRLGRIFVQGQAICVKTDTNSVLEESSVVYRIVQPNTLRITVIEGKVQSLIPPGFTVTPGYRLDLRGNTALRGGPYQITTEQVRQEVEWTSYYRNFRPSLPGFDRLPPPPPPEPEPGPIIL